MRCWGVSLANELCPILCLVAAHIYFVSLTRIYVEHHAIIGGYNSVQGQLSY